MQMKERKSCDIEQDILVLKTIKLSFTYTIAWIHA